MNNMGKKNNHCWRLSWANTSSIHLHLLEDSLDFQIAHSRTFKNLPNPERSSVFYRSKLSWTGLLIILGCFGCEDILIEQLTPSQERQRWLIRVYHINSLLNLLYLRPWDWLAGVLCLPSTDGWCLPHYRLPLIAAFEQLTHEPKLHIVRKMTPLTTTCLRGAS